MSSGKIHFHSLDALRFFAFLKVYLLHIPLQGKFPFFSFLKDGGGIGVLFFFVLSGFLITYLLVKEQVERGKIRIGRFFVRRSLRIWPLFFLMVIVVFLLPYDFKQKVGLHMVGGGYDLDYRFSFTFLENYKMLITDLSPKTTPLVVFWSLCIEEHFYLVWMVVLFFIKGKKVLYYLITCIGIGMLARITEYQIWHNESIVTSDLFTNIDYFAVGGMLGYFMARYPEKTISRIEGIPFLYRLILISLATSCVIFQNIFLPYGGNFNIVRPTIIAIIFTIMIAVLIPPHSQIRIKSRALAYLGKISYGLYVYHIIVIHTSLEYCIQHEIWLNTNTKLILYLVYTFSVTVIISALSYRYFELPFLSLREKLSKRIMN